MKVSKEVGFYCFDALLSTLEERNCAPPSFPDVKTPFSISWAKKKVQKKKDGTASVSYEALGSLISMNPIRLHSDAFLSAIVESALKDPRQPAIQPKDVRYLRCSVSFILEDSITVLEDVTDWRIKEHGIRLSANFGGEQCSKIYPPETICARGWTQREAVEEGIRRMGYTGEITESLLEEIEVMRFSTSTCIVSFKEYLKYVDKLDSEPLPASSDPVILQKKTCRRRRRRYVSSFLNKLVDPKALSQAKSDKTENHSIYSYIFVIVILLFFLAVIGLRFFEATYDKDYDEFMLNYDELEIERHAPLDVVEKAFKKLSRVYHPDKNPEGAQKYIAISKAYQQIRDYHYGKVKLINKKTG
eukprot:CAMPEP_0174258598 /NCGR_PEP_ID=MMETSP0439-20130205/7572_1 /TAXON_ID=0 /ORGANISM="Stereomyxa ramosa, Strain Chinc5" /LENGTH=358 /DNA_ID=CAMNT_0015342169 /DNA_START=112 /DNA_END=1188 /DNA_ORIENTATION=-